MGGDGHLVLSIRVILIVMPVAMYFLILGFLSSRNCPQLLSARLDFALLSGAMSPLILVPAWSLMARWPSGLVALVAVFGTIGCVLAPRAGRWVVYNLSRSQAVDAVADVLGEAGWPCHREETCFRTSDGAVVARIAALPLLTGVTVSLHQSDPHQVRQFHRLLSARLERVQTQAPPAAVALLLVAMAMLVVPVTLMAGRTEQIVRLLSDLLK